MTVDVSELRNPASLVCAICRVYRALCSVDATHSAAGRYYQSFAAVIEEMVWELADTVNHTDVAGNAVTYRAGNVGVVVRVDQFVTGLRHVERKITWATKTYGESE